MNQTKVVSQIKKSKEIKEIMEKSPRQKSYLEQANKGLKTFSHIYAEIEDLWKISKVIQFENSDVSLYPEFSLITDNWEAIRIGCDQLIKNNNLIYTHTKRLIGNKWNAEPLYLNEAEKIYFYMENQNPYRYYHVGCIKSFLHPSEIYSIFRSRGKIEKCTLSDSRYYISSIRLPVGYHFKNKTKLQIILEIGVPQQFTSKALLENLMWLLQKNYVVVDNQNKIQFTSAGVEAIKNGECKQVGNVTIKDTPIVLDNVVTIDHTNVEEKERFFSYYLDCDKIRANMNSYDMAWLEDPNQGHWELWNETSDKDVIKINYNNKIYARNPKSDIKSDCIVGIDFGTKSTVVVCQNESGTIQPMPIGNGDVRKKLEARDFENPTVMQFIDFNRFIHLYHDREGRPFTRWEDLLISHAANESMKDTGVRSTEFYSYLYDLKQWAGEGKRVLNLRDKKGTDILIKPYSELEKAKNTSIDPIELYAYYIGLYINNMNNGIYLEYLLSFPVTYEKEIRNSILASFDRGLRKSLPPSILKDDQIMKRFNVVAGASEPAAYAICALQEYGFKPKEDEKVFYGIFDFGGGTSDFDFGIWTKSKEEDLFDYCIEHFGTQGDRYLGGENLLQLLAFEVFSQNIQLCRDKKIPFAKPNEIVNIAPDVLGYVNDSQEARMNQKLMMEKLRAFWERSDSGEDAVDINQFSEFQISLFDVNGSLQSNLGIEVQVEKLNEILKNRIEKGVKQFFEALKDIFSSTHISKISSAEKIHIFLAGNSSKSPILQEVFKKNIEKWDQGIKPTKEYGTRHKKRHKKGYTTGYKDNKEHFILFPPLGTEEAKKIQRERGVHKTTSIASPTGKTGVAWGLIDGREGGRIEVIEEVSFEEEAKFAYYLGILKEKKFLTKVRRDEKYLQWIKFLPARRKMNEIFYTSLPEAASGNLLCSEVGVFRKRIEVSVTGEDCYIYIRLLSSNTFEYAIGDGQGNINEETIKRESL